jgi:predicted MFS family arabinose efflux permease
MKKRHFIFVCIFFYGLGLNVLNFSMVYRLADQFSFNPGEIGNYMALGQLFYFLGCILYYRFGSLFSPAPVLSLFVTIIFLASIPLGHANNRVLVYAFYWTLQFATALYIPPLISWLAEGLEDKKLAGEISLFNRFWMIANILGPLVAGTLYRWNSTASFILINFCFFLVPFLLFLMRCFSKKLKIEIEVSFYNQPKAPEGEEQKIAAAKGPDKKLDIYRYKAWIVASCSSMFMGLLISIIPIHIRDGLGYTEQITGTILFMRCIASFAGLTLLSLFSGWQFNRRWFLVSQTGLIIPVLILLFAGNRLPVFYIAIILYGLAHSNSFNNSFFCSCATGKNPKKNLALNEMFACLGSAAGSAGGGILYQHFRLTGTSLAFIMIFCLGLALHFILDHSKGKSSSRPESSV